MDEIHETKSDPRYVRSWKCQVSVGELYRWILAKLSDKDIKRALHKYRDLMPRQSDWNRKLTQATSVPELGFRYLYRCGQIDESNHRTMQKMLKYIDRQDVLPYFDTILYNTNCANYSLDELKKVLLDKVNMFLQLSSSLTEDEVHPEPPYLIRQCQSADAQRVTRSRSKRKSDSDVIRCATVAKRMRLSLHEQSTSSASSETSLPDTEQLATQCCRRAQSSIIASALSGPVIHTILSTSLMSMLTALRAPLTQALELNSFLSASSGSRGSDTLAGLSNLLSPSRLLASMPHLLALASVNPIPGIFNFPIPGPLRLYQPQPARGRQNPRFLGPFVPQQQRQQQQHHHQQNANPNRPGLIGPGFVPIDPNFRPPAGIFAPGQIPGRVAGVDRIPRMPPIFRPGDGAPPHAGPQAATPPIQLKQIVLSAGGVGLTDSPHGSLMRYYCSIKLRIAVDLGPSTEFLRNIHSDRQDQFEQQLDRFIQASTMLRSRAPGDFICHLRFNQLSHLEAFWRDYQSGTLKRVLQDMLTAPASRSFVGQLPHPTGGSINGARQAGRVNAIPAPNMEPGGNQAAAAAAAAAALAWMHVRPFVPGNEFAAAAAGVNLQQMNAAAAAAAPWMFPEAMAAIAAAAAWPDRQNVRAPGMDAEFLHSAMTNSSVPTASSSMPQASHENESSLADLERTPIELLGAVIAKIRQREFGAAAALERPPTFDLNVFVSRREYENGRCLLMRNLRSIPSIYRLVMASSFLPFNPSVTDPMGANTGVSTETSTNANQSVSLSQSNAGALHAAPVINV